MKIKSIKLIDLILDVLCQVMIGFDLALVAKTLMKDIKDTATNLTMTTLIVKLARCISPLLRADVSSEEQEPQEMDKIAGYELIKLCNFVE